MGMTLATQSTTVVGFAKHPTHDRIIVFSAQGVDIYRVSDMQRIAWAAIPNVTCGCANDNGIYIGTSDAGVYRVPLTVLDCANGDLAQVFGATADVVLSSYNILDLSGHGSALAIATSSELIYLPTPSVGYRYTGEDVVLKCAISGGYLAWSTASAVVLRSIPAADWDDYTGSISDNANRLVMTAAEQLLICHTAGMRVVDCADPVSDPIVPTASGLVAHYTMDNISGSTLVDEVGTTNATISGATQDSGYLGSVALSFDGVNDYVEIPHNPTLKPTGGLSYSAWGYRDNWSSTGNTRLISCTEVGGWSFEFDNPTAGWVEAVVNIGGSYYQASWQYSGLATGWHLFTATCDGRYVKLYIDGVLVATTDKGSEGSISYTKSNSIIIGGEAGSSTGCSGNFWAGRIDIVRIYNRALTDTEVTDLAAEGLGDYGTNYAAALGPVTDCRGVWKSGDLIAYGTSNDSDGGRFGVLDISGTPTNKTTVSGDYQAVWIDDALTTAIHDDNLELYRLVAQISPGANAISVRRDWALYAEITDALGGIQTGTVELTINGQTVSPTVSAITDGYAVTYTQAAAVATRSASTVELSGTDSDGNTVSRTWSFVTAAAPAATVTDTTPPNVVCTRDIGLAASEADETIGSIPVIWLDDITGPLIVTDPQAVAVGTVAIDGVTYHRHTRSVRVDPTDAGGLQTRDLQQGQVITVTCPAIGMASQKCEVLAVQRNLDDTDEITYDLQIAYYEAV